MMKYVLMKPEILTTLMMPISLTFEIDATIIVMYVIKFMNILLFKTFNQNQNRNSYSDCFLLNYYSFHYFRRFQNSAYSHMNQYCSDDF